MHSPSVYFRFLVSKINSVLLRIRYNLVFKSQEKNKVILVEGHPDSENFGDALNVPLIEYLSKRKLIPSKFIRSKDIKTYDNYAVIGSIIQFCKPNSIIWGAGLISETHSFQIPQKVYAVRGPKTRDVLLDKNINVPEVYGDPALLMPLIYNPTIKIKHKFGFVPHYTDKKDSWIVKQQKDNLIIDLEVGEDYKKVIDAMLSCEKIITSSLHGVIIAHAYKIPVCHVKISDKLTGGLFKFHDYSLSVGKTLTKPYNVSEVTDVKDLIPYFDNEILSFNIRPLINSCPFLTDSVKTELLDKLDQEDFNYLNGQ